MRVLAALGVALATVGCLQVGTGTGTGSGSDGGTTTPADAAPQGSADGGGGSGCGTDPATGVTLCLGIAACPGLTVDQGAFPQCGFRPGTSPFDLECLCNGDQLCPIGVPTSCDSAAQLLAQEQNALTVCQQVAQGSCLPVGGGSSGGSGSGAGSSGGLSQACQDCVSACGGTPSCYESCGC